MVADAYALESIDADFGGAFAGLWLSHVPIQKRSEFILSLHKKLITGATVLFIDNSVAQCVRLPITHTDDYGNTYQNRTLEKGVTYSVLKNFPTQNELLAMISEIGVEPKYIELEHFWLFQYKAG